MNHDQPDGPRQTRTAEELHALLADALSSSVGWEAPLPEIFAMESTLGGPNWMVDAGALDDRALEVVRDLQSRYELRGDSPKLWRLLLSFVIPSQAEGRAPFPRATGCDI